MDLQPPIEHQQIFKANLLVSLQFILIGLLLLTIDAFHFSFLAILFIILSMFVAFWSIITMRKSKLRISPIPAVTATLIIDGPYKYIRHPMYASILLAAIGLLFLNFSWIRLGLAITLMLVLLVKLEWEEKMLSKKFTNYLDYKKRTKRLLPLVF
ncbi:MAG: isoprenylcysteine carboxylmethyltransferase family protein [Bacteroidetes bacterium]|nr:isoprenylcysteine carboxylmethyltransferase family protein [Bacteroidota bacterium]